MRVLESSSVRLKLAKQLAPLNRGAELSDLVRACYFDGVSRTEDGRWYFAKMSILACSHVISPAATCSRTARPSGDMRSPSNLTEATASASASLSVSCIATDAACWLER